MSVYEKILKDHFTQITKRHIVSLTFTSAVLLSMQDQGESLPWAAAFLRSRVWFYILDSEIEALLQEGDNDEISLSRQTPKLPNVAIARTIRPPLCPLIACTPGMRAKCSVGAVCLFG